MAKSHTKPAESGKQGAKEKLKKTERQLIQKADEYLKGWQQAQADLENYRKRMEKESAEHRQHARRELIESLLALFDNLQSLTKHVPDGKQEDPWVQGVLHIARQFEQTLAGYGVSTINPEGQPFDPAQHEAIENVKHKEKQAGLVSEVVQPGYALGEAIIRPAKVKVTS